MQAIVTKYFGPGAKFNARVKAKAQAGSLFLEWNDFLDYEANHRAAALALAKRYGWGGRWVGGGLPNEGGANYGDQCWVNVDSQAFEVAP